MTDKRYEVNRTDPAHEEWARRASQEHIKQARIRSAQADDHIAQKDWATATIKLAKALDHLLIALTHPYQEINEQHRRSEAYELGYQHGANDGKGKIPHGA